MPLQCVQKSCGESQPIAYRAEQVPEVFPIGRTLLFKLIKSGEIESFTVGRARLGASTRSSGRRRAVLGEGDKLIQMEGIAELTTLSVATLRYLRHRGEGPPIFRLGRRLVAWRGDVLRWIAAQAAQDAESQVRRRGGGYLIT